MIRTFKEVDNWNNGQEYAACRLTEKGEGWILSNQEQLQFRLTQPDAEGNLPF